MPDKAQLLRPILSEVVGDVTVAIVDTIAVLANKAMEIIAMKSVVEGEVGDVEERVLM